MLTVSICLWSLNTSFGHSGHIKEVTGPELTQTIKILNGNLTIHVSQVFKSAHTQCVLVYRYPQVNTVLCTMNYAQQNFKNKTCEIWQATRAEQRLNGHRIYQHTTHSLPPPHEKQAFIKHLIKCAQICFLHFVHSPACILHAYKCVGKYFV